MNESDQEKNFSCVVIVSWILFTMQCVQAAVQKSFLMT
jgi:hypothetical protein